jgi:hypothetical protein
MVVWGVGPMTRAEALSALAALLAGCQTSTVGISRGEDRAVRQRCRTPQALVQTIAADLKRNADHRELWEEAKLRVTLLDMAQCGWPSTLPSARPDKPAATWIALKHPEGAYYLNTPIFTVDPRAHPLVPDYLIIVNLTNAFNGIRRIP